MSYHVAGMLFISSILLNLSCNAINREQATDKKPNILWIFLEDTSPMMGCYGEKLINTPNIDQLAKDGILFDNAIMPAPVCSPCRSAIITGVMATTIGAHQHHSSRTEDSTIELPHHMQTIPELFKAAGYFTFNNGKDDYNFSYEREDLYSQDYRVHPLYGKSGIDLPLSYIRDKQPFFGQIQLRGGKEIYGSTFKENIENPVDRAKIELPPYLPNHPIIIEEYAKHLDAIQITDHRLGEIVRKLEEDDLLKNTIIFFFSDHGMRLTRHKQFLYEGGLRVPLIIADYSKSKINESGARQELISGIDLGPTSLALAGIPIPAYMEGRNIFDMSKSPREYVVSARDRCDFTIDRIRSIRTEDFKYIRNFMTDRPYTQPTYMDVDQVDFVKVMHQLNRQNKLDSVQSIFFSEVRPLHELYDLRNDPHEINNLSGDPDFEAILQQHITILDQWIQDTNDKGQYPEDEENLKLMLGIWGEYAVNPEYDQLKTKHPNLPGSQFELKNQMWKEVKHSNTVSK